MLGKLEQQYAELLAKNNWKENDETRKLAQEYKAKNHTEQCMECNKLASIDCQFH